MSSLTVGGGALQALKCLSMVQSFMGCEVGSCPLAIYLLLSSINAAICSVGFDAALVGLRLG